MKRKPYNPMKRFLRERRALLSLHRVAVVNIDPEGRQGLVDWLTCKNIKTGRDVAEAVCDIAHSWTIYLAAFCVDEKGLRYMKAAEVAPRGIYRSDDLARVLEEHYTALVKGSNPNHRIGSGWIAIPSATSLDDEQADRIFEACGAWSQARVAA